LTDSFFKRLDADTRDWLSTFVTSPYTTCPVHPALLKMDEQQEKTDGTFRVSRRPDTNRLFVRILIAILAQVYVRIFPTTIEEESKRLRQLLDSSPGFQHHIQPKLDILDGLDPAESTTIYSHYIGQSLATDSLGRLIHDFEAAPASVFGRYLGITPLSGWQVYEIKCFTTTLIRPDQEGPFNARDTWLANADIRELEYGVILAGSSFRFEPTGNSFIDDSRLL
jgi:hypothetical protein